jgi:hypothetical protein
MIAGALLRANKGPLALLRGAKAIVSASRELAGEVSNESDGWFRFSLTTAERSIVWAERRVFALAGRVRLWPGPKHPRERIQLLLRKEARRAPSVVAPADIDLFTERMAILIDLVLSGSIAAQDIAFEAAEASTPAAEEPQPTAAGQSWHEFPLNVEEAR